MILVTYDPQSKKYLFPDSEIMKEASSFIDMNNSSTLTITTGSELFIMAIRVLIKENKIDHKDVVFIYKGNFIYPNKDARLEEWPKGFCDHWDNMINVLVNVK